MPPFATRLPNVMFQTRVRDDSIEGDNPFTWKVVTTQDLFYGKRSTLFSLPAAFTPTCSTYQLPDFEKLFPEFQEQGIDQIYCLSVNDAFVMNAWAKDQGLENVKVIPDGSGIFTAAMDMDVKKDNLGFGMRSWRYAVIVGEEMNVEQTFIEPGFGSNISDDPYGVSSPQNILAFLKGEDWQSGGVQLSLNLEEGVDSKVKMG